MRKLTKIAALCAALALTASLLAACGGNEDSGASQSTPPASSGSQNTPASSDGSSSSEATGAPAAAATDAGVSFNGVLIEAGKDAAPVLDALGEPTDFSEVISCMFVGGMDKTYTYDGIVIYTYPTDTQEVILMVDVTTPEAETSRGVKVGDALDAALLAYSNELAPEGESNFSGAFGDVQFTIMSADGAVTGLSYYDNTAQPF